MASDLADGASADSPAFSPALSPAFGFVKLSVSFEMLELMLSCTFLTVPLRASGLRCLGPDLAVPASGVTSSPVIRAGVDSVSAVAAGAVVVTGVDGAAATGAAAPGSSETGPGMG